jgi:hypothetical protein
MYRSVANILVSIDLLKGLVESIDVEVGDLGIHSDLDYGNVSIQVCNMS